MLISILSIIAGAFIVYKCSEKNRELQTEYLKKDYYEKDGIYYFKMLSIIKKLDKTLIKDIETFSHKDENDFYRSSLSHSISIEYKCGTIIKILRLEPIIFLKKDIELSTNRYNEKNQVRSIFTTSNWDEEKERIMTPILEQFVEELRIVQSKAIEHLEVMSDEF